MLTHKMQQSVECLKPSICQALSLNQITQNIKKSLKRVIKKNVGNISSYSNNPDSDIWQAFKVTYMIKPTKPTTLIAIFTALIINQITQQTVNSIKQATKKRFSNISNSSKHPVSNMASSSTNPHNIADLTNKRVSNISSSNNKPHTRSRHTRISNKLQIREPAIYFCSDAYPQNAAVG